MSKHQQKCIRLLTVHFLGWGDSCTPHRYIRVATTNGELLTAKVSKQLRPQIQDWEPGIWLAVMIQERIDMVTGSKKIKVRELLQLPDDLNSPENLSSLPVMLVEAPKSPAQIRVCQGSTCRRRGSEQICQMMQEYIDRSNLTTQVEIKPVKCLHQCKDAPHIVTPDLSRATKTHHRQVRLSDVDRIMTDIFPTSCPLVSS
jgi:NADH:ubiquinone oxidoreductase subunit E